MKKWILLATLSLSLKLFGFSIMLMNDSSYPLTASIRGADGTILGQIVLQSGQQQRWSDDEYLRSHYSAPSKSLTPYRVVWLCPYGGEYSRADDVSTAAYISAATCTQGSKYCQPKPKDEKKTEKATPSCPPCPPCPCETKQKNGSK
jgi:hypothetical protein